MVGVPRFELGSKRPKRPSIGQTNPYARCVLPRLHCYQLHSRNCHKPSSKRRINPSDSAISKNEITDFSKPFFLKLRRMLESDSILLESIDSRRIWTPFLGLNEDGDLAKFSALVNCLPKASLSSGGVFARMTFILKSLGLAALSTTGVDSPIL